MIKRPPISTRTDTLYPYTTRIQVARKCTPACRKRLQQGAAGACGEQYDQYALCAYGSGRSGAPDTHNRYSGFADSAAPGMGGFHGPEGRSRLCRVHLSYCRISGGCNCAELDIAADFLSTGGRTDAAWSFRGERLLRTGPETGEWDESRVQPFIPGGHKPDWKSGG